MGKMCFLKLFFVISPYETINIIKTIAAVLELTGKVTILLWINSIIVEGMLPYGCSDLQGESDSLTSTQKEPSLSCTFQ